MSNIFITDIVGAGVYAVPTNDAELATATAGLNSRLASVSGLSYDRVLAWVEDSGGPGAVEGARTLNCLIEKFTVSGAECPSESDVDALIAAIEFNLELDADITSVGNQQVHIFQAGAYFLWNRDVSGGFLYPNVDTDDVAVGPFAAPTGMWFADGDLVLGAAAMSGTEVLRIVGDALVEGVVGATGVTLAQQGSDPGGTGAGEGTFFVKNDNPTTPYFASSDTVEHPLLFSGTGSFADALAEPTGFPNRTDSTISFNDGTLTFSIAPTGASFDYWIKGVVYSVGSKSKAITDTEGEWFFYLDNTGTLQASQIFPGQLLVDYAICGAVYWDSSGAKHIYIGEERHGCQMSGITHQYLHQVFGTQWISGGALGGFSVDGDGDLDASAQFDCASLTIADEDIYLSFSDGSPQTLTPQLQAPVFYRSGAGGDWNADAATSFPCKRFGGAARLAYNQYTGGAWQQTEVPDGDYVLSHIWATNDIDEPIIVVQGQNTYTNQVRAREGATTELNSLVTEGLPFAEFTPLGTVIYQTDNAYGNTVKARVVSTDTGDDYVDFRSVQRASAGVASAHSDLAGLLVDDHPQYALLTGRAGNRLVMADDATTPPWSMTERAAGQATPASGDIYLNDGTLFGNGSGVPGFQRWTGAAWEDVSG
ncbi:MAG TPA: hypothetical protein VMY18_06285, partial [Acidobacteriota bacterium]|nr:hypothetical protein [Acidobacteriota bacterium]